AFKFTHDGGKITLTFSMGDGENQIALFVEDNGAGMTPEHLSHAFDRFYSSGDVAGTGLGLSLSKEFVELHHGQLIASSEVGKGTRFCMLLPLGKDHLTSEEILHDKIEFAQARPLEALVDDTHVPA